MPRPVVRVALGVFILAVAVIVLAFASAVGPALAGYRTITVETNGLAPDIPQGAVIVQEAISPSQVQPGDVVSFMSDRQPGAVLTHRVVSTKQVAVAVELRTVPVGAPNATESVWLVHSAQPVGRMVYWVPFVGTILGATGGSFISWGLVGVGGLFLWGFARPGRSRATEEEPVAAE